ncbi:MAG: sulfotransferase, partial [Pseudomonadota bacterium]
LSQIQILDAEDLRWKRTETLSALFTWLGLPNFEYTPEQLTERHVSPPTSRTQRFPFVRAIRDSGVWASARPLVPDVVRKALSSAGTKTIDKSSIDETDTRNWLQDYFEPRIEAFERTVNLRFSHWKQDASRNMQVESA